MIRWNTMGRMAALGLLATSALTLGACGKRGYLETPAPLFGDRAKARYEAQKQQAAQDSADAQALKGKQPKAAADQSDDAPLTTRDIKSPEQKNTPLSRAPTDGLPNPVGPSISPTPPN
jgi:predicted small lipoprotein YifL